MIKSQIDFIIALKRITEALESLSKEELERLSDSQYSIEIKTIRRRSKEERPLQPADDSIEAVIKEITELPSRQDAQTVLDLKYPSKKILQLIARRLDIPIIKQDKLDELRDKIVEATVGAKIRSQAIQGTAERQQRQTDDPHRSND